MVLCVVYGGVVVEGGVLGGGVGGVWGGGGGWVVLLGYGHVQNKKVESINLRSNAHSI